MATVRFGVAVRDITPDFPVMLHGYASRDCPSTRVSEPIQAAALCLEGRGEGGDGRARLVVLALDMIGVDAAAVQVLRADLARECGLDRGELLVAASHTHFAPCISPQLFATLGVVEPDPRYVALVRRAVVDVVRHSCAEMHQGELQEYRTSVPSVLFNRRMTMRASGADRKVETNYLYPSDDSPFELSPVDGGLTVLRIVAEGAPRAAIVNFGCHPVTGGRDGAGSGNDVSADYPWYLREVVGRAWGCPVLFTLGAAGDAVPIQRAGLSRERIGATLGNSIVLGERVLSAAHGAAGEAVVAHRAARMEAATIVRTRETPPGDEDAAAVVLRAFRSRLYPDDRFAIEVAIHRIGDTVLVAFPFEVLSEVALTLKRYRPGVVVVSVANGYQGYLPQAHEYGRGGYEATPESTHFVPGTMDRLLDLVREELDRI